MSDQGILDELNENFTAATDELDDIRKEGATNMRFVSGDPWDEDDKAQRKGRPMLALDEINQYTNQLINDVRQNKRAIKVSPGGNGADDKTAEFRANKIREIEYRSHAQDAYTTAFENAVQRGYGYLRVTTKRVREDSLDQEIWIEPIPNPDLVTPDPYALRSTFSDQKFCFVHEFRDIKDFKKEFKDAAIVDFDSDLRTSHQQWFHANKIRLAEYWKVETRTRTLLMVTPAPPARNAILGLSPASQGPQPIFRDTLSAAQFAALKSRIVRDGEVDGKPMVTQYLTNGVEILSTTRWSGKYIPIVACVGKVIYVENGGITTRKILSLVNLARAAYKLYCYYRSCEAEVVGMTPKTPYWAYEGSISPEQLVEIQKSLHEPVAALFAKPTFDGMPPGALAPLPMRQMYEPAIQALEIGAEAARRAIQSAMGTNSLPTSAQRRNEKSGIALQKMDEAAQRGSFHFVDHYEDMLTQTGVVISDLIASIHDTARETAILKPNDEAAMITINDPRDPASIDATKGDHNITISTGPKIDSEREAANAFSDALIGTPQIAQILGPQKAQKLLALAVKLKALGPIGDEMVEAIDPQPTKDGEPPDPQQVQAELAMCKQQLEALTQAAQGMKQALETDAQKQQATLIKSKNDNLTALQMQRMKDATSLAVAKIAASAKGGIVALEAENEQIALAMEQAHEAAMAAADAGHDEHMAELGQQHALEAGDQAHQQALAEGEQGQAHALEQGQQAADLAPQSEAGA